MNACSILTELQMIRQVELPDDWFIRILEIVFENACQERKMVESVDLIQCPKFLSTQINSTEQFVAEFLIENYFS